MNQFHQVARQTAIRKRLQLIRTWRLVWRSAPWWTLLNGLIVLFEGLIPLLSLFLLKLIIDGFTRGLGSGDFGGIGYLIAGLAGVAALTAVLKSFGRLVTEAHGDAVSDYVQGIVQTKSTEVDLQAYESSEYHDLLLQVQTQASYRPARITRGFFAGSRSLITGLALIGLIIQMYWQLAIILFLFALPGVIVRLRYAHQLLAWHGRQSALRRVSSYLHGLITGIHFAKEVRLFNLGSLFCERAARHRKTLRGEKQKLETQRALLELIPNLCSVAALFISFWLVARRAMTGSLSVGEIVIYYQAFQRCQSALAEFLSTLVNLYEDNLFLSIFYAFLSIEPTVTSAPVPCALPSQSGLVLEHVTFRYPGTDRDVLTDVSVTIPHGQIIALVGENGAGKSTLAKLICRLYDPDSGVIRLDGIDIRKFDITVYRRCIGVIFQDFNQYHLTVRENIWLGDPSISPDDPRIEDAAKRAGIETVIGQMPDGYDTHLGREYKNGIELSVGQWQRIALARALLRDSRILIMDEPTSAMDPKAEHGLHASIKDFTSGRTALLISHRLSTVTMADRICVLENGRVAETGSHTELMNAGQIYADLFLRQSQAYRT